MKRKNKIYFSVADKQIILKRKEEYLIILDLLTTDEKLVNIPNNELFRKVVIDKINDCDEAKTYAAASVILINPEGQILCVSRKDNHNDFGLAGGKVDEIDNNNPEACAIRECKEETGLDIFNLKLIHNQWIIREEFTFIAEYSGEINYNEPHLVKWGNKEDLLAGSFASYNKKILKKLNLI